jgi:hypothetical protein
MSPKSFLCRRIWSLGRGSMGRYAKMPVGLARNVLRLAETSRGYS